MTVVITREDSNLVLAELEVDNPPTRFEQLRGVKIYVVDVPVYNYVDRLKYLVNTHGVNNGHVN